MIERILREFSGSSPRTADMHREPRTTNNRQTNNSLRYAPLGHVDLGLLADKVGITTTNTSDVCQGVHDVTLAVNVGVQQTQNVLELVLLGNDDLHHKNKILISIPIQPDGCDGNTVKGDNACLLYCLSNTRSHNVYLCITSRLVSPCIT